MLYHKEIIHTDLAMLQHGLVNMGQSCQLKQENSVCLHKNHPYNGQLKQKQIRHKEMSIDLLTKNGKLYDNRNILEMH